MTGMEHSATGATGSAFEPTPWLAVQRAAWEVLRVGKNGQVDEKKTTG